MSDVIAVTSSNLGGKRIVTMVGLRSIVGGEIHEYGKLLAQSREQALDRMCDEARSNGANVVLDVRFATSMVMGGAAEILAYGTAVVVEDELL